MRIPANRPHATGSEIDFIREAIANSHLSGNGPFTRRCQGWIEERIPGSKSLLTHSATGALEMAALLADIAPGDEIIMPSYTFVSTANAFVLRGGVPVFVDIRPDTLNMDEELVAAALTEKTRAIVPVHYAGVACEMDVIRDIAQRHGLLVIEDAAQGIGARYRGEPLGGIGDLAALSFHETKNVISGEGGALLVNDPNLTERAEIIWEKGTDRSKFFRGEIDKYTWVDVGSSFLASDLVAAFLWAQLANHDELQRRRREIWERYHRALAPWEDAGALRRPIIPQHCEHNAHLYYVLLAPEIDRRALLQLMCRREVQAVFHYVPLHSSPAGKRYGRVAGTLDNTERLSGRIIRLPLWLDMSEDDVAEVVAVLAEAIEAQS